MQIQPLNDQVLIRRVESESVSTGGIVIPDAAKEDIDEAIVVAVGPGKLFNEKLVPVTVKVGDRVMFEPRTGSDVRLADEDLIMLSEEHILAVYE